MCSCGSGRWQRSGFLKTERGVTLTEEVLFGGEPRQKIDIAYTVHSKRKPEGKTFTTKAAATKYLQGAGFVQPAGLNQSKRADTVSRICPVLTFETEAA